MAHLVGPLPGLPPGALGYLVAQANQGVAMGPPVLRGGMVGMTKLYADEWCKDCRQHIPLNEWRYLPDIGRFQHDGRRRPRAYFDPHPTGICGWVRPKT